MKAKLTDRNINRKAPAEGTLEIWDTVQPGLALRIHAGGKCSYCLTTRLAPEGRQIRRTIGTTATHKLAEARDAAREIVRNAAKGIDSASREARQEAARLAKVEQERAKANSFRNVVEGYLADPGRHGAAKMKSKRLVQQRLENHAMPVFGDRPIASIHRSDVKDLLRGMVAAGKPIAANRLLGNFKLVLKWAVEQDKLEASPIADLDKPADEQSRDRVLTADELRAVWQGCESLSKAHAGAIRLMILTGARRTEAGSLLRSEINGEEWHLPAARSKNGKPHIWPLSEQARAVIASVPQIEDSDPVFTLDGRKSVNGWSKTKAKLDRAIAEARAKADGAEKVDPKRHPLPHWVFHDLRRSLVTGMVEDLGIAPHVVEATVNHVSGVKSGVAGIYNRSVLLPQRKEALEAWGRHIEAIVTGAEPAANVTRLKRESAA